MFGTQKTELSGLEDDWKMIGVKISTKYVFSCPSVSSLSFTKNFKFKDFAKCRKNSLKNFLSFKLKDPVGRVGRAR